jgi:hypothetical protein
VLHVGDAIVRVERAHRGVIYLHRAVLFRELRRVFAGAFAEGLTGERRMVSSVARSAKED